MNFGTPDDTVNLHRRDPFALLPAPAAKAFNQPGVLRIRECRALPRLFPSVQTYCAASWVIVRAFARRGKHGSYRLARVSYRSGVRNGAVRALMRGTGGRTRCAAGRITPVVQSSHPIRFQRECLHKIQDRHGHLSAAQAVRGTTERSSILRFSRVWPMAMVWRCTERCAGSYGVMERCRTQSLAKLPG